MAAGLLEQGLDLLIAGRVGGGLFPLNVLDADVAAVGGAIGRGTATTAPARGRSYGARLAALQHQRRVVCPRRCGGPRSLAWRPLRLLPIAALRSRTLLHLLQPLLQRTDRRRTRHRHSHSQRPVAYDGNHAGNERTLGTAEQAPRSSVGDHDRGGFHHHAAVAALAGHQVESKGAAAAVETEPEVRNWRRGRSRRRAAGSRSPACGRTSCCRAACPVRQSRSSRSSCRGCS